MTKNKKKLRKQERRGSLGRTLPMLVLAAALLGGTVANTAGLAHAADNITIANTHSVLDGVTEQYAGIKISEGGSLTIARSGKVKGTDVVVGAGGSLTSAKNLHFGTFPQEPDTGLLANTLTVTGTLDTKATATASHMGLSTGGVVTVGNNGWLKLDTVELGQGKVIVNSGFNPSDNSSFENAAHLTFTKNTTLAASDLTHTATVGKIALEDWGARLWVNGLLTLKGVDTSDQTLDTKGKVKPATLKVVDSTGALGNLTVSSTTPGGSGIPGGHSSGLYASGAATMAETAIEAAKITVGNYGLLKLGEYDISTRGTSGTIKANIDVNGASARMTVRAGQWALDEGKTLHVKNGSFAVGEKDDNNIYHSSMLDTSKGTLKVDAGASGFEVVTLGILKAKYGDFTADGSNLNVNGVNKQLSLAAGASLHFTDYNGTGMTLSAFKALTDNLLTSDSKGTVQGVTITGVDSNTALQDVGNAKAAVVDAVVNGSAGISSGAAVVGGLTGGTTISGGANLGLTGQGAAGGKLTNGNVTLNGGALTLGNVAGGSTGGTLTGSVDASTSSGANTINVVNGQYIVTGDITGGTGSNTLALEAGTLKVNGSVDMSKGTGLITLNRNGGLNAATLKGSSSTRIAVGDTTGGGTLVASNVTMGGGQINFDPAFIADGNVSNASMGGLTFAATGVDALMNVGQNSMVSLGSTDAEWLRTEILRYQTDNKGLWGRDITAALALRTPQTLAATGGIKVDGTWKHGGASATANTATFAGKSLLVVDAGGVGSNVALSGASGGTSTLTVANGAKLHIVGGQGGNVLHITDAFGASTKDAAAWTGANLTTSTGLLSATGGTFDAATGKYSVTLSANAGKTVFPLLDYSLASMMDSVFAQAGVNVNSDNAGVRFLSRAASDNYIGRNNTKLAASTIEGAAQMAVAGAVPGVTLSAVNAATNAATSRMSLATPMLDKSKATAMTLDQHGQVSLDAGLSAGSGMKNGLGLWIMPLYQSDNTWGMESGNFSNGYNSNLGGIAVGADYTFADAFRVGLALNMGGGYAQSNGDFNDTKNSFNFWGVSLYGGWAQNNFGVSADVGYTGNYNKVEQELPQSMRMSDLKADVMSSAITAGLRGEYKFATSVMDIIPHVGLRYTSLNTDGYDVKSSGTVFAVDQTQQNLWTFPVGVTFAKDVTMSNGWVFKPQLDVAVIPAAGDLKAKSRSRVPGFGTTAELETQVVDNVTWQGGLGFDIKNDNLSLGLNYTLQASEHRTGHMLFGTVRYEF